MNLQKNPIKGEFAVKGKKRLPVLTEEDKIEVCKLAASYKSTYEIRDILETERGKSVSQPNIHHIIHTLKWKPVIERMRLQYTQGIMEVPISNKRKRMERLDHCYEKAFEDGNIRSAIAAIDSAREEMEPRHDNFNLQLNQFNLISDEELIEIKNRLEEKQKRIKEITYAGGTGTETDDGSKE